MNEATIAPEANVSGEEQLEYEKALDELGEVLYKNEAASDALLGMIQPENKVDTTVKTIVRLITQIDEKIDIAESVFYTITMEAVDRLTEMAEENGVSFSEKETQQVAMAAWEGVMGVFGGDEPMEEDYSALSQDLSDADIKQGQTQYEELKGG